MANPILDQIKLSGTTYDIQDSSAIHSLDGYWNSGQTTSAITAATAALAETISEELSAKTDVSAFTAHTSDTTVHVTSAEKSGWDAKLGADAVSGYADSVKYNSTSKYVEFYHGGTGGTKVFEYDASPFLIDGMVQNVEIKDIPIEETLNLELEGGGPVASAVTSALTNTFVVEVTDSYWTSNDNTITFVYKTGSTSKHIIITYFNGEFSYESNAGYTATATSTGNTISVTISHDVNFVELLSTYIDSVKAVYGSQTCLVISFNTDAGKQDINIPISEIFDASNYYTTAQTQSAITQAVSGKQDTLSAGTGVDITDNVISVTGVPNVDQTVISGSTNPVAGGAVYTELQGKQTTLVSGTNIKSINNESLLGSGNITTLQASVSGTTLILS